MPVKNRFAELQPEIAAWRRDFHENPELDYDVHRTAGRVAELLRGEAEMSDPATVAALQDAADTQTVALRSWLETERRAGRRVYAYGAASRAVALFCRAGVDASLVAAVADGSRHGSGICPVRSALQ